MPEVLAHFLVLRCINVVQRVFLICVDVLARLNLEHVDGILIAGFSEAYRLADETNDSTFD